MEEEEGGGSGQARKTDEKPSIVESHYTIKVRHNQLCFWFKCSVAACHFDPSSALCLVLNRIFFVVFL